jgi:hypothetical protein
MSMAFSAAALQGVTLKKTAPREAPTLVKTLCADEAQYQKLMQVRFALHPVHSALQSLLQNHAQTQLMKNARVAIHCSKLID